MIDVLIDICNRIWRTGEWSTPWTQSLIIILLKKGSLQLCQNYRSISLISHSSKDILEVILNRLKPQAEEIIAEEQAGCNAGRSTTEQIFYLRILYEKYLKHQQNLYHVFIDSKKPLTEYGTQPYGPPCGSTISVQFSSHQLAALQGYKFSPDEWQHRRMVQNNCRSKARVSSVTHPLQHFLERIMSDALGEHDRKVSIGGSNITNLRFADNKDTLA